MRWCSETKLFRFSDKSMPLWARDDQLLLLLLRVTDTGREVQYSRLSTSFEVRSATIRLLIVEPVD